MPQCWKEAINLSLDARKRVDNLLPWLFDGYLTSIWLPKTREGEQLQADPGDEDTIWEDKLVQLKGSSPNASFKHFLYYLAIKLLPRYYSDCKGYCQGNPTLV